MKPKVFVTKPIPEQVEAYLNTHCELDKWEGPEEIPRQQLLDRIADVEGLLTTGGSIDQELLAHAPRLRVVSNISVGYNNFDLQAMRKRGVWGTNTPHVLTETVADLAFALILATARRVAELDKLVKEGRWTDSTDEMLFGTDVHGKTLGIIGMGRIGAAIAKRARYGFDMTVSYYNRHPRPDLEEQWGVTYLPLNNLLQTSDFVLTMIPLTDDTIHFIGKEQFAQMKPTAIFINVSRGKIVDEFALIEALKKKQIWGAGLDVFEEEPVSPVNPLLQMPNVVTLPHIGSATKQTRLAMAMLAAKNLVAALQGNEPPDLVPELRMARKRE
ncbi:2-hydroxyacid dehydrogenase [Brevibacillus migulae]|uniref:2-hydroxyacid dehydrogenase n=1 Tax=Brevibacillus migulae TaxID=1644114 RepID=UPI00106E34D3|nr:D-glycerate dehydrogenase [Brevibacillus migulae]